MPRAWRFFVPMGPVRDTTPVLYKNQSLIRFAYLPTCIR